MTALLAHLYALRGHLDAVILAAELEAGVLAAAVRPDPRVCPGCGAPAEAQGDTSTLDGTRRLRCSACGLERDV